MKIKRDQNWVFLIIIFSFLVFTEIANILVPVHIPFFKIFNYTSIVVHGGAIIILFYLVKEIDKKANEFNQSQQRLQNIFDTLDVAIWSHDLKTDELLITKGIEKLYGYKLEKFYTDKLFWKKVIYPEDLPIVEERGKRLAAGETVTSEYRIIRPGGEVRWIQDGGIPTIDHKGEFVDFTSVLFDITDRKESQALYQSLVEMSPDIIAVVSEGSIDYINEAGYMLLGAANPEEIIGQPATNYVPVHVFERIKEEVSASFKHENGRLRFEFQVERFDGTSIDVEMAARSILYEGRFAVQIVGRDITQRKKTEKTIQFMAYYDTLTGLPNRNQFRKHLNKVLHQQETQTLAVLFLDLDHFKCINDTMGHSVGDIILQKVAGRLENAIQSEGLVSRQGGDEFIILLEDANAEGVVQIAEQILNKFSAPFEVNNQDLYVTTSIGISMYPTDGTEEETLIKKADAAMYHAKELGKNNYQFYSNYPDEIPSSRQD